MVLKKFLLLRCLGTKIPPDSCLGLQMGKSEASFATKTTHHLFKAFRGSLYPQIRERLFSVHYSSFWSARSGVPIGTCPSCGPPVTISSGLSLAPDRLSLHDASRTSRFCHLHARSGQSPSGHDRLSKLDTYSSGALDHEEP